MNDFALRKDQMLIAALISPESKVLDLGCGDGELLHYLESEKQVDGRGLDVAQDKVSQCVAKGLSVIQGDIDEDIDYYSERTFDYVISSHVLQLSRSPETVLRKMLSIGKYCIISMPNFGYWRNRSYLFFNGKMPVTKTLSYQWYETPNIHFCTISDFCAFCEMLGCEILDRHYIGGGSDTGLSHIMSQYWPNAGAEKAVFLLHKDNCL